MLPGAKHAQISSDWVKYTFDSLELFLEDVNGLHVDPVLRVGGEDDVAVAADVAHLVSLKRLLLGGGTDLEVLTAL